MGLFARTKKNSGLMAIRFQGDGVSVACIKHSSADHPAVTVMAFYPSDKGSDGSHLEKIVKELQANRYSCTCLLAANDYQIFLVDAPNVPPDELKTAIRWRLKDMLEYHVDDATIDVLDIPLDKNAPPGRNHSLYAVAARNQLIALRQNLFNAAKIPLTVIDIPDMAQRNISALCESPGRGLAMLSFDLEGGLFTVTFAGELYLSRRIDAYMDQFTKTDDAQKTACFERITLELQRSLDHFDRQFHFIAVAKLILAPIGDTDGGLKDYLSANLYVPVEALNLESVLDISEIPALKSLEIQRRYFLTIGAALRLEEKAL